MAQGLRITYARLPTYFKSSLLLRMPNAMLLYCVIQGMMTRDSLYMSVQTQICFPYILNPQLVESVDSEPADGEGDC